MQLFISQQLTELTLEVLRARGIQAVFLLTRHLAC